MENIITRINKFSFLAKESSCKYLIVMVCNVKEITKTPENYQANPVDSEYYSLQQYIEISETIKEMGFSLKVYFDENDFIEEFSTGKLKNNNPKKIIVLNSAQKGISEGRKSLIPAFCDLNNIIHTNSNAYVSSFSRNKYHWYSVLRNTKSNVCPSWLFDPHKGWLFDEKPAENMKVICKLNSESSSIGLKEENIFTYSKSKEKFIKKMSLEYNSRIIVQKFISGKEVELPVILDSYSGIAMEPVGIKLGNEKNLKNKILSYDIRGNNKFSFYKFSEDNPTLAKQIQKNAEKVAYDLGIFGFGRIDYRIDDNNNYFITDISTNPHLTMSMSIYYNYKNLGYSYDFVLATLLGLSISRNQDISSYEEHILTSGKTVFLKRAIVSPEEWISLRKKIGWEIHSKSVHQTAINHTLYGIILYDASKKPIGMGRVVGDSKLCFYLQDIGVVPRWQKQGVGTKIVTELLEYISNVADPKAIVGLMATDEVTETYYANFGFKTRKELRKGAGMIKELS
ncbi:GNAT family N-acetyltransferase [Enterococcus sp. AZ177]|uniref:GNAT family N-acetyltransferase n=1 Tax=unclassified Enterococcus TaxID=2608891 RepID=UPI003D2FCEE6